MALLSIGIFYNGNESSLLPSLEESYTVSSEEEEESKEDIFELYMANMVSSSSTLSSSSVLLSSSVVSS